LASGKKSYFRHYNDAFNDAKIQKAIELLGYEGYAYYFILIELFAKHCENEVKNPIVIHQQTVRILLRKSQQSCNKVVTKLQESGLFVVTFRESLYEFSVPNLTKYLGKYDTKFPPNAPNKRKEKEIKENKIKQKEKSVVVVKTTPELDIESIYAVYPRKEGKKKGMEKLKREINSHEKFTQLQVAVKNYAIKCKDTETRFIKQFSSFASTWEDYLEVATKEFKDFTEDDAFEYFEAKIAEEDLQNDV
jgi:hypothetical protein